MPEPLTTEQLNAMTSHAVGRKKSCYWSKTIAGLADDVCTLAAEVERLREECKAARELLNHVADAPLKVDILKSQQEHLIAERDRLAAENAELRMTLTPVAKIAECWAADWPDSTRIDYVPQRAFITIGDCRRAAELLARNQPQQEKTDAK